jgi:hypothetical protein
MATAPTIDIDREELLSVTEARQSLPRTVAPGTLRRWITLGVGGHRLEAVRIGGKIFTSRQALARFVESMTADLQREPSEVGV